MNERWSPKGVVEKQDEVLVLYHGHTGKNAPELHSPVPLLSTAPPVPLASQVLQQLILNKGARTRSVQRLLGYKGFSKSEGMEDLWRPLNSKHVSDGLKNSLGSPQQDTFRQRKQAATNRGTGLSEGCSYIRRSLVTMVYGIL